jgi:prolyl-tRNA synthetase
MAGLGAHLARPATSEEIFQALGAHPGSLGAVTGVPATVPVYADLVLQGAAGMVTGANDDGFHYRHVNVTRDIRVTKWADFRTVCAGELAVATGLPLKIRRGVEVGHVFKLGTKYSEKLNSYFLAEDGQRRPCIMGCYGIGVTRTLQAVIEQCHDKDGIVWPINVAPYQVCLTPLAVTPESRAMAIAEKLHQDLTEAGIEVILDDRDERPGVKFKDSELIGFPLRVNLGEKSLAKGEVELKPRIGPLKAVKIDEAFQAIVSFVREAQSAAKK